MLIIDCFTFIAGIQFLITIWDKAYCKNRPLGPLQVGLTLSCCSDPAKVKTVKRLGIASNMFE